MSKKKTIKQLPKVDRPREKLIKYGPEKLSNPELLAILMRTGKKGQNVIDMSKKILKTFPEREIAYASVDEIKKIDGLGPAKASEIVACFELGKRILKNKKSKIYLKPQDIWNELAEIRTSKKEHFVIFYLDGRNQEIKKEIISIGTLTKSLVHPREVFEPAVRHACAHIIIAHNHPSGNLDPSEEDLEITLRLVKSGKILGIEVLDHIIVTEDGFSSLKEKKLI